MGKNKLVLVAEVVWPDVAGRRGGFRRLGHSSSPRLPVGTKLYATQQATDPNPIKVMYIDGVGASRTSPEDCRDGVRYITVEDTVYWPLSDEDAQRLHSAACGRGEFTGPALTRLHAAAPELLEALQNMVRLYYSEDRQDAPGQYARAAVAAIAKATGG